MALRFLGRLEDRADRLAILRCEPEFIYDLLSQALTASGPLANGEIESDAPRDLEIVYIFAAENNSRYHVGEVRILCRSVAFEKVAKGNLYPIVAFTFARKEKGKKKE